MYSKLQMGAALVAFSAAAGFIGYELGASEKYGPLSEIGACASMSPVKSSWATVQNGNRLCMVNNNTGTVIQFEVDQEKWPDFEDVRRIIDAFIKGEHLPVVSPQP